MARKSEVLIPRKKRILDEIIEFLSPIYLILPAALWPWVESTPKRNEYQKSSSGVKRGRRVGLTIPPPSVKRLSRKCGTLDVSKPNRPLRSVTGIALCFSLLSFLSLIILRYFFTSHFFIISFILVLLSSFSLFSSQKHDAAVLTVFSALQTEPVSTTPRSCIKARCIILIATHLQGYYVRSGSNNQVMARGTVISPAN
jgi:hypothetical protein